MKYPSSLSLHGHLTTNISLVKVRDFIRSWYRNWQTPVATYQTIAVYSCNFMCLFLSHSVSFWKRIFSYQESFLINVIIYWLFGNFLYCYIMLWIKWWPVLLTYVLFAVRHLKCSEEKTGNITSVLYSGFQYEYSCQHF